MDPKESADQMILRALQEDHAALKATSPEARIAHETIARELRESAQRLKGG